MSVVIITGDCREVMAARGPFDMVLADPPYGDTALSWDKLVEGWLPVAAHLLKTTGSLWLFGSMRWFMGAKGEFDAAGLRYAQDVVWEKPNGTGFASDRFKRVHEHAVQFYHAEAPWAQVYNDVQRNARVGGSKAHARQSAVPVPHTGAIGGHFYDDDGTRIMRSVLQAPSVRGGIHRTQKPVGLLETLIRTSCPTDGLIGDFFAGSGACGEAASLTGRNYVGCEIDPVMADKARQRLAGHLFAGTAA